MVILSPAARKKATSPGEIYQLMNRYIFRGQTYGFKGRRVSSRTGVFSIGLLCLGSLDVKHSLLLFTTVKLMTFGFMVFSIYVGDSITLNLTDAVKRLAFA
jgi:hypothetical protein